MSKAEPIKTNLFRFVTLRTPQLISKEKRTRNFIEHPNPTLSHFLSKLEGVSELSVARSKVMSAANDFHPVANKLALIKMSQEVYQFSEWLSANRNELSLTDVISKTSELSPIPEDKIISIWDNLFYDILVRNSTHLRQLCVQLIVANNFIKKTKTEDDIKKEAGTILVPRNPEPPDSESQIKLYLKRLCKARVIIPSAFSIQKMNPTNSEVQVPDYSDMEMKHMRMINSHSSQVLQKSREEFANLELAYSRQYTRAFRTANSKHKIQVDKVWSDFLKKAASQINEPTAPSKNAKGVTKLTDSEPTAFPKFEFTFPKPLSQEFTKSKLTSDSHGFIKNFNLEDTSISSALNIIDKELGNLRRKVVASQAQPQATVLANGNAINTSAAPLYRFTIGFLLSSMSPSLQYSVYFTLDTGYSKSYCTSSNYSLVFGGSRKYSGTGLEIIDNTTGKVTFKLFPKKKLEFSNSDTFTFTGTFTLDKGKQIKVSVSGIVQNGMTSGLGIAGDSPASESEDPKVAYGVSKVGILDYRRVEQELCCYVPGEVSHIENILAKEYKERTTRSLISTETLSEETSDVEIENQTDLSTTARNEMSSEIANVLASDKSTSLGLSSGVNLEYPVVSADFNAYADFASSNSSSNSNSIAKTYAEEVTEKALERVLQKIATKRSSKILQEYEENNRHGFDNRGSDKNVTGVYRWVDKVYTNRLVNYGKRLLYEFMIPEPSKFYKQAIATKVKDNSNDSSITVIEKPQHPKDLGIHSAADIDESTYQILASAYKIRISPPLDAKKIDNKSVTPMAPPDGKSFSNPIPDIFVPEGYKAKSAALSLEFEYKRNVSNPNTYFTVQFGPDIISAAIYRGHSSRIETHTVNFSSESVSEEETTSSDNSTSGTIAGSVSGLNIWSYSLNIVLTYERLESNYKQWQDDVYTMAITAYDDLLETYQSALEQAESTSTGTADERAANSELNRTIEKTEIKRLCIEMLTKPFSIPMGRNFYLESDEPCNIPSIKQTKNLERYASHVKFFEQAFDWSIVSYIFYPYYWAKRCDWIELLQSKDSTDPLFQAFLQSGMARVNVPVRPGFEDAVTYYLETGDIWNGGGLVIDSDDELYISIVDEIEEVDGVVEEEWQSRVPSTLTVVQNESVVLNEGGLPCCDELQNDALKTSTLVIGGAVTVSED